MGRGANGVRCFWIVPRRFCGTICLVFCKNQTNFQLNVYVLVRSEAVF